MLPMRSLMKLNTISLVILLLFFGGASKGTQTQPIRWASLEPGMRLPFNLTVVESAVTKEISQITNKALTYLDARDYDKLDGYAAALRTSKESWATGSLKLGNLYAAFNPPSEAPDADWERSLTALQGWILARPNSITARVALASVLVEYAWKARGSGWALHCKRPRVATVW